MKAASPELERLTADVNALVNAIRDIDEVMLTLARCRTKLVARRELAEARLDEVIEAEGLA